MTLKEYIKEFHGGNKSKAAEALKLSRRMLYKYLQRKSFPVRKKALNALKNAGIEVPTL